jgi:uncharacterized protein YecE (DUF72 family)
MAKVGRIRIGVGGWTFEPWRGVFYPAGLAQARELDFASRALGSIEINGTYYGAQKPASFARWRDATPEGFVFSVKAPRFATSRRVLAEAGPAIARFLGGGVLELGEKLGPINWQFLPTKTFDAADMAAFLALLPAEVEGRALRHVLEVRHPSFRCEAFVALARQHQVAIAVAGDSAHPQIADATAPFVYARIMGTLEGAAQGYPDAALEVWARRARAWAAGKVPEGLAHVSRARSGGPRDVFLYVIGGHKVANPAAAQALMRLVEAR